MIQKTNKIFIKEIYSKPTKRNLSLLKPVDDIWSSDK